jgi:murein L,D-transpeptidase YcbB/YkuD
MYALKRIGLFSLAFLSILTGRVAAEPLVVSPPAAAFAPSSAQATAIQDALAHPGASLSRYGLALDSLRRFYERRGYEPAWSGNGARNATIAIDALASAATDGLDPNAFHVEAIKAKLQDASALAEGDVLLTAAVLQYMHDLRFGRVDPSTLQDDIGLPRSYFDPSYDLQPALANGTLADVLTRMRPPHQEYEFLRAGLAHYRALRENGDATAGRRVEQILANMERWRWLPAFEERYIEVNVADSTLKVVDHGTIALASRVIVGKPENPTPLFSAMVTSVTVNPYWSIPARIANREIRPRGRGYVRARYIVTEGGQLRQRPGPRNALGRVKLEMPNSFDAYLHDTPSRSLFARDERHLSHGCVRVELIRPLASFAMSGSTDGAIERLNGAIATGKNRGFALDTPLPVHVLYWTAIADANGDVAFVPDVYGRDAVLIAALANQRPAIRLTADASSL